MPRSFMSLPCLSGRLLDVVTVTRPPRAPGSRTGRSGIHLHVATLWSRDVTVRRGVPVTSVERTVVDLARTLPFRAWRGRRRLGAIQRSDIGRETSCCRRTAANDGQASTGPGRWSTSRIRWRSRLSSRSLASPSGMADCPRRCSRPGSWVRPRDRAGGLPLAGAQDNRRSRRCRQVRGSRMSPAGSCAATPNCARPGSRWSTSPGATSRPPLTRSSVRSGGRSAAATRGLRQGSGWPGTKRRARAISGRHRIGLRHGAG